MPKSALDNFGIFLCFLSAWTAYAVDEVPVYRKIRRMAGRLDTAFNRWEKTVREG